MRRSIPLPPPRPRPRMIRCTPQSAMPDPVGGHMPKIAEIEGTPNRNALKFILREPLTWGVTRSYDNAEQAKDDPLAAALFEIDHVTNVFYVDRWITITQDGGADWQDLARDVADPIRAAPAADRQSAATVAAASTALAGLSTEDQERLEIINALLD